MKKCAILILAHNDFNHLKRLINKFDRKKFDIFIHIDKKTSEISVAELKKDLDINTNNNVFFVEHPHKVYWGGFSIVEAEIELLNMAIKHDSYMHYILISGSDYPIRSTNKLSDFLSLNEGNDFIKAIDLFDLPTNNPLRKNVSFKHKLDYPMFNNTNTLIFKANRRIINSIKKKFRISSNILGNDFHIYHGSQWWALTENTVIKILNEYKSHKNSYDKYFKNIFAPDEKFFHSIYYNLFNKNFSKEAPIEFYNQSDYTKQTAILANLTFIDASLKKWFTEQEFNKIISSSYFFVRKVSSKKSSILLDLIDENMKETGEYIE